MKYEPRGKVAALIRAMRERPQKEIWTSQDVALEMDVHQASLTAHLDAAIRNGALHRRMDGSGRCQYSVKLIEQEPLDIPRFIPPRMVAPREGSDIRRPTIAPPAPAPTEAPAPAPAPVDPSEIDQRFAAAHYGHDLHPGDGQVLAAAAEPEPEPAPPQEEEEKEEEIQPDAFLLVRTGEWTLVGCPVDEEGRVTVPKDLMAMIKAQMVWSLAR